MGKTASLNIWRRLAQRRTSGDDGATDCLRVWYEDTYLSLSCVCQASLVHASGLQGSPWPNAWRYASEEGCVTTPVGDGARSRCNLVPADRVWVPRYPRCLGGASRLLGGNDVYQLSRRYSRTRCTYSTCRWHWKVRPLSSAQRAHGFKHTATTPYSPMFTRSESRHI